MLLCSPLIGKLPIVKLRQSYNYKMFCRNNYFHSCFKIVPFSLKTILSLLKILRTKSKVNWTWMEDSYLLLIKWLTQKCFETKKIRKRLHIRKIKSTCCSRIEGCCQYDQKCEERFQKVHFFPRVF